jgi:hypothetical protein
LEREERGAKQIDADMMQERGEPFLLPCPCCLAVAQHLGITEEAMRADAAPLGALGGDQHRLGRRGQCDETEPVEVSRPRGLIGEAALGLRRQTGDQGGGQSAVAHVFERRIVQHKVDMAGAQQIEEVQPALRGPRAELGESVVADLRAEAVLGFMPRRGVIDGYPR